MGTPPAAPLKNEAVTAPMDGFGPLSMRINQRNPKNFAPETAPVAETPVVEAVETVQAAETAETAPEPASTPAPVFMPFPNAEAPAAEPAPVVSQPAPVPVAAEPAPQAFAPAPVADESFEPSYEPTSSDEPDFGSILSMSILQTAEEPVSQTTQPSQSGLSALSNELTQTNAQPLVDFPSLTELKSLASELMSMNLIDTRVGVGAAKEDKIAQSSSNHEETTKTSD